MSQELQYTSAPRGLFPGSHGYCTVVCTDRMPRPLIERLESLSVYRNIFPPHDPRASLNPVAYSSWLVPLAGTSRHVLSRVSFSGLDYTDRTNKFAHHVVLEDDERPRGGPAWLLNQPGFMKNAWDGSVTTVPDHAPVPEGDSRPGICASWAQATGDAGWAGVLAEEFLNDPRRVIYLVYEPGTDLLPLITEAQMLLPADRRWNLSFCTYFTSLPAGVTCAWRGVAAGSPEAAQAARQSRALVLDLTTPLGSADGGALVEQARTGRPGVYQPKPAGFAPPPMPGAEPPAFENSPRATRSPSRSRAQPDYNVLPTFSDDEDTPGLIPPPIRTDESAATSKRRKVLTIAIAACLLALLVSAAVVVPLLVMKGRNKAKTSIASAQPVPSSNPQPVLESKEAKTTASDLPTPATELAKSPPPAAKKASDQPAKPAEVPPLIIATDPPKNESTAEETTKPSKAKSDLADTEGSEPNIPALPAPKPQVMYTELPGVGVFGERELSIDRTLDPTNDVLELVGHELPTGVPQTLSTAFINTGLPSLEVRDKSNAVFARFSIVERKVRFEWRGQNNNDLLKNNRLLLNSCILKVKSSKPSSEQHEKIIFLRTPPKIDSELSLRKRHQPFPQNLLLSLGQIPRVRILECANNDTFSKPANNAQDQLLLTQYDGLSVQAIVKREQNPNGVSVTITYLPDPKKIITNLEADINSKLDELTKTAESKHKKLESLKNRYKEEKAKKQSSEKRERRALKHSEEAEKVDTQIKALETEIARTETTQDRFEKMREFCQNHSDEAINNLSVTNETEWIEKLKHMHKTLSQFNTDLTADMKTETIKIAISSIQFTMDFNKESKDKKNKTKPFGHRMTAVVSTIVSGIEVDIATIQPKTAKTP